MTTFNYHTSNQMEGKIATILGLITGWLLQVTGTQLVMAIGVAFMTGGASYLGTVSIKFTIVWLKRKFTVKISPKKP